MITFTKRHLYTLGLSLLALVFVFTPFFSAHAAGIGLTIQPVKISQTLKPGDVVNGTIKLSNASDEEVNVEVKVEDFIPTAGAESIQFVGRAAGVTTARDWVTIGGNNSFVFKQNETKDIPYTITAPANAEPGSHFAVAFFKATKVANNGEQLKIGTQVGMLVLITVPGSHLQKGQILDFTTPSFIQHGPVHFNMKFENTGTVHFEPKGTVKINNMFGKEVASVPIEGQVVLPTGVKNIIADWNPTGLLIGKYTASASVLDGEGLVLTSKTVSFWAFPVWYVVGFLVALIIVFFIIKLIKSRVKISINLK